MEKSNIEAGQKVSALDRDEMMDFGPTTQVFLLQLWV